MPRFSEETLTGWTRPPSQTEETKLSNASNRVREAIKADEKLKSESIEIFGQGSYANNTNVRLNSDIDINVRFTGGFYFDLPEGKERSDFGLDSPIQYSFSEFKNDVQKALTYRFGQDNVVRKNKCIRVLGNSNRVQTDVVPTWNHRRYNKNGNYVVGARLKADSGEWIVNYPKQHIANGIDKNKATERKFKRLVRLYKKIRYKMIEDELPVNGNIQSFLLECLVWNIPNRNITSYYSWTERLKQSIIYLYKQTESKELCKEWGEVSELLYLFHSGRKWSIQDVHAHLRQMWNYLQY